MKFINRSNKILNRTILNEAYKIISCKMTGWTILNAILSCGNKLYNFENDSKTCNTVSRIYNVALKIVSWTWSLEIFFASFPV